jgi:hypothetical protein
VLCPTGKASAAPFAVPRPEDPLGGFPPAASCLCSPPPHSPSVLAAAFSFLCTGSARSTPCHHPACFKLSSIYTSQLSWDEPVTPVTAECGQSPGRGRHPSCELSALRNLQLCLHSRGEQTQVCLHLGCKQVPGTFECLASSIWLLSERKGVGGSQPPAAP